MSSLLMLDRALITDLEVIEGYGGPEYFSDGMIMQDAGEVIRVLAFVDRMHEDMVEHHEILRIHMRRSGFERSLIRAWTRWRGAARH